MMPRDPVSPMMVAPHAMAVTPRLADPMSKADPENGSLRQCAEGHGERDDPRLVHAERLPVRSVEPEHRER